MACSPWLAGCVTLAHIPQALSARAARLAYALLISATAGCSGFARDAEPTGSRYGTVSASEVSASTSDQTDIAALRKGTELQRDAADDDDAGVEDAPSISDDSVRCGNGVLDPDELCDVAIPSGEPGACPNECAPAPTGCPARMLSVRTCWSACVASEPSEDPACALE
jgi:hypothetical protein